jgi:hypothetical protein
MQLSSNPNHHMPVSTERAAKAEQFFAKLYESAAPPVPVSAEENERICHVLRGLCTPVKATAYDYPRKSKPPRKAPLRLSTVVKSLGYPPMDRGTLVCIADRLELYFKRMRGKKYTKPPKGKCFCLGLGEERIYSEEDRPLMRMAVVHVLGPLMQ